MRLGKVLLTMFAGTALSACRPEPIYITETSPAAFNLSMGELKRQKIRALEHMDSGAAHRVSDYYQFTKNQRKEALVWLIEAAALGDGSALTYLKSDAAIEEEYFRFFHRDLRRDLDKRMKGKNR